MTQRGTSSTFIPPYPLNTAVLFLVFNRLDTTKKVFEVIRQARPTRLYIAADGARENVAYELEKVRAVRDFIIENIDWECEVKYLFRDQNLGCKYAVSEAITWFFENEEAGIILEDDCLPSPAFFEFASKALREYSEKNEVFSIAGTNLIASKFDYEQCFSLHGSIWGWATWRRAWSDYNVEECSLSLQDCYHYATSFREFLNILAIRRFAKTSSYRSWDYQWLFHRIKSRGLTLMPKENLVINIGFDSGTHHDGSLKFSYPPVALRCTYKSGITIKRNVNYDKNLWSYKNPKNISFDRYLGVLKRLMRIIK